VSEGASGLAKMLRSPLFEMKWRRKRQNGRIVGRGSESGHRDCEPVVVRADASITVVYGEHLQVLRLFRVGTNPTPRHAPYSEYSGSA